MRDEPNGNVGPGEEPGIAHPRNGGPKVGLVLGGGGVLGAAWLIGAIHALHERTGWDPNEASHIVGTSAGSVVGALVGAGMPTWFLVYHQRGGEMRGMVDRYGEPIQGATEREQSLFRFAGRIPRFILGSPGLAIRTAVRPWRYPPTAALVGWVGRGFLATEEIGRIVRSAVNEGWADHPNLWIVAVDYNNGKREVFGSPGAPGCHLWEAVEASCSIPGLYRPVKIAGRTFIDGGAWSPSNADLLARTDCDIVIAMNPMSSLHPGVPTTVLERIERRFRRLSGRRLGHEVRKLHDAGKRTLLIQPRSEDLHAMGWNLMNPKRRRIVLETAIRTTSERLEEADADEILGKLAT